jgi:hypothetical protein
MPRVQYARRYNVIPADAPDLRAVEIFLAGWRRGRETAGGSYDDAGIGDLQHKTAVLWDLPPGEHAAYRAFFHDHYPGTRVEFAVANTPQKPLDLDWRPAYLRPPRAGTYRVKLRLEDRLQAVSYARWNGIFWLDALPDHAITAWAFLEASS